MITHIHLNISSLLFLLRNQNDFRMCCFGTNWIINTFLHLPLEHWNRIVSADVPFNNCNKIGSSKWFVITSFRPTKMHGQYAGFVVKIILKWRQNECTTKVRSDFFVQKRQDEDQSRNTMTTIKTSAANSFGPIMTPVSCVENSQI